MRPSIILLFITALVAVSCKKHKDIAPKVDLLYTMLESYEAGVDNTKQMIWYANDDHDGHRSMNEITVDKSLEAKVYFGRYKNNNEDGLYAPMAYPVLFGQQAWTVQNKTVFRKPAFSEKEFQEFIQNLDNDVTAEYIDKAYNESTIIGDKVSDLEIGDVFVFSANDGKTRGIVLVNNYFNGGATMSLGVWVK